MRIRPVQPEDFGEIAELTNHYIRSSTIHFGYQQVTAAELRTAWERARERYPFFVAETQEKPGEPWRFAGYAKSGVWRDRDAYQWTAELGIYVAPSVQKRGVGRALYSHLIEECRRTGFHSVIGGITLPNEPSVALHQALGFTHIGTFRRVGWKLERWNDVDFWQLPLRDQQHHPSPLPEPRTPLAAPAAAPSPAPRAPEPVTVRIDPGHVQLIELTHKRWKAMLLLSLAVFLVGISLSLWMIARSPRLLSHPTFGLGVAVTLVGAGLLGLLVARLGAWWRHG